MILEVAKLISIDAYKNANKKKIDGSKICVDYERGRTVEDWRPRRFGGGKGTTRISKRDEERFAELWKEIEDDERMLMQDDEEIKPSEDEKKIERKKKHEAIIKERSKSRSRSRSRSRSKSK